MSLRFSPMIWQMRILPVNPSPIFTLPALIFFFRHVLKACRNIGRIFLPIIWIAIIVLLFTNLYEGTAAFAFESETMGRAGTEKLIINTANGPHEFKVEVMRTGEELEKGLMFRKYLPADRGMLFDFGAERPIAMWMKNTYIPLDMIFISRRGQVTSIAENAEPLSEDIISSNGPVYAVLEVNGGTAAKFELKIGDRVINQLFKP